METKNHLWIILVLATVVTAKPQQPLQLLNNGSSSPVPLSSIINSDDQALQFFNIYGTKNRFKRVFLTENNMRTRRINFIVERIRAGQYEIAKTQFIAEAKENFAEEITDRMALRNPNYENLLAFFKELPWLSHRMHGYAAMVKKSNLGYSIFKLKSDFLDLSNRENDTEEIKRVQSVIDSIKEALPEKMEQQIQSMAHEIAHKQPEDYEDLVLFFQSRGTEKDLLLQLVEKVYRTKNIENFKQIMALSDALTGIGNSAIVYIKLYQLMENDIKQIAVGVKALTRLHNYPNVQEDIRKEIDAFIVLKL